MSGERYLANVSPAHEEVHDLDNEQDRCQIDAIIAADNALGYQDHAIAQRHGYDNCAYCIGNSTR